MNPDDLVQLPDICPVDGLTALRLVLTETGERRLECEGGCEEAKIIAALGNGKKPPNQQRFEMPEEPEYVKDFDEAEPTPATDMLRRVPPQNIQAEQSLLGAILLEPSIIGKISQTIVVSDFYRESHREIYKAMANCGSEPIDAVTVSYHLKQAGMLDEVGGPGYLAELAAVVPTSLNASAYADIVRECALKRDIIRSAGLVLEHAYNGSTLPELSERIARLSAGQEQRADSRPALMTYRESARLAAETELRPHVIENLLTAEDISGLAAKKGIGKSTLLRTMAVAVSKGDSFLGLRTNQTRVWYLDLEPGSQKKRHEALEQLGWDESSGDLILTASPPVAGQPWAFEWLEENIVKYGFGLVIIDTLFKFCKIDQSNDYSSGLYGSAPLEGIMKRTKVHFTVAHHSQKNANPNNPNASAADLFLGAVSIAGSFGVCLAMRRQRGGQDGSRVTLFMDPPRYTDQVIEGEWILNKDTFTGRIELGETLKRHWWEQAKTEVMAMARQMNRPFTVSDLLERSDDYKRKEAKRILNKLVDKGDLVEMGKEARKGGAVRYGLPKPGDPPPSRD